MRNEASELWRVRQEKRLAKLKSEIKTRTDKIQVIKDELAPLRQERDKIHKDLSENRTFEIRGNDRLRVPVAEVAPIIKRWRAADENNTMALLAQKASISRRLVFKILQENPGEYITLTSADRILQALGLPHKIRGLTVVSISMMPKSKEGRN